MSFVHFSLQTIWSSLRGSSENVVLSVYARMWLCSFQFSLSSIFSNSIMKASCGIVLVFLWSLKMLMFAAFLPILLPITRSMLHSLYLLWLKVCGDTGELYLYIIYQLFHRKRVQTNQPKLYSSCWNEDHVRYPPSSWASREAVQAQLKHFSNDYISSSHFEVLQIGSSSLIQLLRMSQSTSAILRGDYRHPLLKSFIVTLFLFLSIRHCYSSLVLLTFPF